MKCFIHQNSDAVAVCRSCGRALCPACVSEVGLACACKNRCETDVQRFNEMIARGRPGLPNPSSLVGYDRVIFLMLLGVALVGFGCYIGMHGPGLFLIVLGGLHFIFGVSQLFITKKIRRQFQDKNKKD